MLVNLIQDVLTSTGLAVSKDEAAELAVTIDDVIERLKIVQWEQDLDVQNRMRTEIEDELFRFSVELTFDAMDRLMDGCIDVARRRSVHA